MYFLVKILHNADWYPRADANNSVGWYYHSVSGLAAVEIIAENTTL